MPICRKVIVIYPQFLNSTKKIAKEGKAVSNSSLPIEIWARVWCQRRWRNKNKVTAAAVAAMGKAIKFPGISEGVQKLLDVDIDSTSQQPLYFPLPPPSPLSNFQTYNDGFSLNNKVITLSITGALNAVLSKEHKLEICRYLYNHQNRDDGWGLHIEGPSTMFGTILNYVTLRLLGEGTNDGQGAMKKGRQWILDHGSATAITSWGKMWLSVQNSPLNLFVHLYNFLYFVCIIVLIILGGDRFLVYLNGLEIIPCPLRRDCFHIFFQSTQDAEVPWHLIAIAIFFTLIKLPGPYYPYWGRILVPHFANGGLLRTLWFAVLWYRMPKKIVGPSVPANESLPEQTDV